MPCSQQCRGPFWAGLAIREVAGSQPFPTAPSLPGSLPQAQSTSSSEGVLGLHDSLESHADEGAKFHVHLGMRSVMRHVHRLHRLREERGPLPASLGPRL